MTRWIKNDPPVHDDVLGSIQLRQLYHHTFLTRWSDRFIRWSRVSLWAIPTVVILFIVLSAFIGKYPPSLLSITAVFIVFWGVLCFIVFCIFEIVLFYGKQRLVSSVVQSRCQRCPECFYDLSQRPRDDEICPECGIEAPRRECVRLWCKLLRSRF